MRDEFTACFRNLQDIQAEECLYTQHRRALLERAREYARFRKWKKHETATYYSQILCKLELWEMDELIKPVQDEYRAKIAEIYPEIRYLKYRLNQLAQVIDPRPGELWKEITTISGSTYSTQGYGANDYARGRAEAKQSEIQSFGIKARVVKVDISSPKNPSRFYTHVCNWKVEAQVESDVEVAILQDKRADFKEWLRFILKKGLNPSVFLPGTTPSQILNDFKLDWQGRDLA